MEEMVIGDYIKYKIDVVKQFGIRLSSNQNEHLHNLKSEISIDNYMRQILKDNL